MPVALLRPRQTGRAQTVPRVYARDGGDYVFVASNNGSDRPPGGVSSGRPASAVQLEVGRLRMLGTARVAARR